MTDPDLALSLFAASAANPHHLSVGAIVRDDEGAFVLFRKGDLHAFMTETVENGESIEQAVARGLLEEMGATAPIARFAGATQCHVTDERGRWQKTVLWFDCVLAETGGPSDIPDWEIVRLNALDGLNINGSRWPFGLI